MIDRRIFTFSAMFIFFMFAGTAVFAQKLDSLLYELDAKYPQEKIYIQYDRPYYNPGETIWFKAYLTSTNLSATISKTLYAELIDEKGKLLQKKIMPVAESGAASFFELPDTINASAVFVRAYTSWMLNFDPAVLYSKSIGIISNSISKKAPAVSSYSLTFFPEGGDLVNGIESRVAFKAINQDGNPINVSGNILNSKGDNLMAFSSVHNGMGSFALKPVAGETYKAIWKDKKNVVHETMLPAAKKQGLVLSIINADNKVTYILKRPDVVDKDFTSFFVIAQMQQHLIYSARINLSAKSEVIAPLPVDSLANGIVQLTVFNADEIPVAERIFFINHNNFYFNTDLHAVELNLTKRKRNVLQVDVGGTIVSNLSIAVTDEALSPVPANRDNIYSNILLSSDLRGNIYNPAYYFSSDEDSVAQQLDLVMLTNGWRRFRWEDLLARQWPEIRNRPEDFITISGNVYGPSATVLKGKEITGILKTKAGDELITIPVETDGRFAISGMEFFDTAKLYYQFNHDKDKQLTSTSSFAFKTNFANPSLPLPAYLSSLVNAAGPDSSVAVKNKKIAKLVLEEFKEGKQIKSIEAVTLKTRVKTIEQKLDEKYTSGFFTGDGYTFSVEDDPFARTSLTVLDYLKSKVAGLQISTTGTTTVTWRGSATSVFLNESPTEITQVQTISMNDVAMIKVFRPPFFSATGGGAGGAIAVYLKKGESVSTFKGLDFVRLTGYSPLREFYSPDYEKPMENIPENDLRTTLYWNPFLLMDKSTRRIKIPFFNSDNCKKIRVIIEGINKDGQLTREEKLFE